MGATSLKAYTDKVRALVKAGKLFVRVRHIEQERRHREINRFHVEQVLASGKVTLARSADKTIVLRGLDVNGRELELLCSLLDDKGKETLVVREVHTVKVGTAYDPAVDDKKLLDEWLSQHSDYEKTPDGKGTQKRIMIEKK